MQKSIFFLLCFLSVPWLHADDSFKKQPDKPVDLAKDKNLYVVGYAHLDTQWRWTYPYDIQFFIPNTMKQNFQLLEKYPNYIFNFTGSRRYEFMKEYYPEDYAKVKQYVAAGRWFPAGSSVDENDANIPSLESFTRHFLYGNRFFQHEFGLQSQEYMLPDCFGFPASLPTILSHGGIKGFSTQKLSWGSAVGIPFSVGTWVGSDGSSVMAALNPGAYNAKVREDLSKNEVWLKRINETGDKSGVYADYHYYGTGDRGGAPDGSSVQWIERSLASDGPIRVVSSRSDQIFKDITPEQASKLPSYKGELLLINHSAGSLTSQAYMKRWNRKNEQLANAAESAATVAHWLGAFPYPQDDLYAAWDLVLGSQMHDIMPGTSLPKAYEYSWNDEVLALNQFASVTERASAAVISTLDTTAKGIPVAVYNPLSIEREDTVEATIPITGDLPSAVTAYDPQGQPVPTQILGHKGNSLRVLFVAKVPPIGYAVYDLRPEASPATKSNLTVTANSLENSRYRVTLNDGGDIASVFDKTLNKELLSSPARLSIHTEDPAQYPAWNMDWNDRQKPARGYVDGPAKIRIVESGPARVALEVERMAENGTYIQQIRLAEGSPGERVEILDHIDWRSSAASLKADFPFAAANPMASYDDKVGVVQRDNDNPKRFEVPMQQWMDLTNADGSYGVSVLNDSKYGADKPDDHTLRLTLLYTPGTRGGSRDQGTQDQGRHEILYALVAHQGDWVEGRTQWQSARLNQPLRAFLATAHPGSSRTFSLLSLNSDQVQVEAVKKAEDSDEIIVRLKELSGKPAPGLKLKFPVAITSVREVDAQERPIGEATLADGQIAFDMKPYSLRAFAVTLAPATTGVAPVTSQSVPLAYNIDVVSSRTKRDDGAMDANGSAYPAEQFPARLTREGVNFQLGPITNGRKNAVTAHGQTIDLPQGDFNRVQLLAAANGDTTGSIKIGDVAQSFNVPNWTGFIGQWDNRLWDKPIAELDYNPSEKTVGLVPGYIKRTPVAWFSTHHNTLQGDAFYQYSYLFQLGYDLPKGTKHLTLPNNPKLRVFAVSVSHEPSATPSAAPLYDTLADHQPGGLPIIPQAGQTFHDATEITLVPPLYHQPGDIHYTTDGSDPSSTSAVYESSFLAEDTVNLAVRQIDAQGNNGPVVRGAITVHDQTPPRVINILDDSHANTIDLTFHKPVAPATITDVKNYAIQPAVLVTKAALSADHRHVVLTLGAPLTPATSYSISLSGIKDASPSGNLVDSTPQTFYRDNIVYALKSAELPKESAKVPVPGLPLNNGDAWTMNLLVKTSAAPEERTIIAGFGSCLDDNKSQETGRYFAVFKDGIRFWSSNNNLVTYSPFEVGRWQMLTATYNGKVLAIYKDGVQIKSNEASFATDTEANVGIGIIDPWGLNHQFQGTVQAFTIRRGALTDAEVKALFKHTKPTE